MQNEEVTSTERGPVVDCIFPSHLLANLAGITCHNHTSCKPVPKDQMTRLLLAIQEATNKIVPFLYHPYFDLILDGLDEIQIALDSSLWKQGECRYCYLEEFFEGQGRLPWLVVMKMLEETEIYERTISCLKVLECNIGDLERFVDEVLLICQERKDKVSI
jgi:hypothetical protein